MMNVCGPPSMADAGKSDWTITMARRTKEDAQATRNALLDAAERVFHAQGVSRTSLAEIAYAAGMTRGAIYWHFKDKADLFNAMMERVILPLEASVLTVGEGDSQADAMQELRHAIRNALLLVAHDDRAQRVFEIASHQIEYAGELAKVRERRIEGRDACMAKMEATIRLAAQTARVRLALPAEDAAFGLNAVIDGVIRNWLIAPAGFDLALAGMRVVDAFLAGIGLPVVADTGDADTGPAPSVRSTASAPRRPVASSSRKLFVQ
jgi:TetR/AcrR family acrAB operon transcriptional repressor